MKNEKTAAKKSKKVTAAASKAENPRARLGEYKGFTSVQIIRQMGAEGWKAKEASEALAKLGLTPNIHTCYVQVLAGSRGVTPVATLPKKELAGLRAKAPKKAKAEKAPRKEKKAAVKIEKASDVAEDSAFEGEIAEQEVAA